MVFELFLIKKETQHNYELLYGKLPNSSDQLQLPFSNYMSADCDYRQRSAVAKPLGFLKSLL